MRHTTKPTTMTCSLLLGRSWVAALCCTWALLATSEAFHGRINAVRTPQHGRAWRRAGGSDDDETSAPRFTNPTPQLKQAFDTMYQPGAGQQIFFGVFKRGIGPNIPSPEESARRRAEAAEQLVNIDADERARRGL